MLRGESARQYALGSLAYAARIESDLPLLAPRALAWYAALLEAGLSVPFGVVLDLGYLLLEGEQFRFRGFFADNVLSADEREIRQAYEARVLSRRLQEANFLRARRIVLDHGQPDRAVVRVLELALQPASASLSRLYLLDQPHELRLDPGQADLRVVADAFEAAEGRPGLLLQQLAEITAVSASLDFDRLLAAEELYELEHLRVFARHSLRLAARGMKRVERLLGPRRQRSLRLLRERALAETSLESTGTYPTGGIAELTTSGPIENLVPSELIYLDPGQPMDPFLLRFAENELLKFLRDSTVLRMMRRSVVFYIEDCADFVCPIVKGAELHGTKAVRCLMGLVLALVADLLAVFRHDDVDFVLRLVCAPGESASTTAERREIVDVLHLLLREKEEQGNARVESLDGDLAEEVDAARAVAGRSLTVVVIARPQQAARVAALPRAADRRVVAVAVHTQPLERPAEGLEVPLAEAPLQALRTAREAILQRILGR